MNIHVDEKGYTTIQASGNIDSSQIIISDGRLSILGDNFSFSSSCSAALKTSGAPAEQTGNNESEPCLCDSCNNDACAALSMAALRTTAV